MKIKVDMSENLKESIFYLAWSKKSKNPKTKKKLLKKVLKVLKSKPNDNIIKLIEVE